MASCYLIFSRQRFNASDLASHFVPSSGGPHMNLRVVFQTLKTRCKQKNAFASYLNGCVHEKKYYKEIIKPCIGWMKQCMCVYLCVIEDTSTIIGANHCIFPILAEVGSGDKPCLAIHLIPQSHLLIWNVPEP